MGRQRSGVSLLGVYSENGQLQAAGGVGTGWDTATAGALRKQLAAIEIKVSPFNASTPKKGRRSRRTLESGRWVEPIIFVAEVEFVEWTPDGSVRRASFKGRRTDKDPLTTGGNGRMHRLDPKPLAALG